MKKIIILTWLLAFASTSFGQQPAASKTALTQTDYLKKSKKQKQAGFILSGAGAGLIIASFIIPRGELESGICIGLYCDEKYKNDGIKSAFLIAGAVTALSSIPLFIVSGMNRKKANTAAVFIDMKNVPVLQQTMISNQSYPVLKLKISL